MKFERFLISDGATTITLHPEWDFSEAQLSTITRQVAASGKNYIYRSSTNISYSYAFSLQYVSSADASKINEFWEDDKTVLLTAAPTSETVFAVGKIVNLTKPLNSRQMFEDDKYNGIIMFRSIDSTPGKYYGWFELDNSLYGLLDKNILSSGYMILDDNIFGLLNDNKLG